MTSREVMAPRVSKTAWAQGDIFSRLRAGQVAEVLAADGEQRPEHHDLLVLAALHHGLEAGAQRERGLAGAGAAAEGDDADLGVEQHLQGDPLLGRAAVDAERLAVAADQAHLLVGADPAQGGAAVGEQHQAAVAGQVARGGQVDRPVVVQLVELGRGHVELGHAGVAGVGVADRVGAVLLGVEADRGGLDAQRQVLGDQRDVVALVGEVARDGEDPGVVVAEPEARRAAQSGSVWLSSTRIVPPSSPTGTGSSRRPWVIRSSSSIRRAVRAKKPSSGW